MVAFRTRIRNAWRGLRGARVGGDGFYHPQAYRGGQHTRQTDGWNPRGLGPNLMASQNLDLAKRRVRDLMDNNPLISGGQTSLRRNIIANGIHPEPDTGFADLDEVLGREWKRFAKGVDPERKVSLAQSQGQMFDELFAGGEVLPYFSMAPSFKGYPTAPALELIDCERLELDYNETLAGGSTIRQGVEFDEYGRAIAYHVLKSHPRDDIFSTSRYGQRLRISTDNATLAFIPRRIGQIRGVPWIVSGIETCSMEEGFNEAFLLLARMAACVSVFLEGATDESLVADSGAKVPPPVTAAGETSILKRLVPGLIGLLKKGIKPTILTPNLPPPSFGMVTEIMQRRMAAAIGIGYSVFTRDYSKATFSATRAEGLEDRKGYRAMQLWIVHFHTDPLYRRFVDWCITSGRVKLSNEQLAAFRVDPEKLYSATWLMPGWEWVNPLQEATAAKIELETGISDLVTECAQKGRDWRAVLENQYRVEQYDARRRKELGLPPSQRVGITVNVTPAGDDLPPGDKSKDKPEDTK